MTSLIAFASLERDPRDRAIAPVIAPPLVTTILTIRSPRTHRRPSALAHVGVTGQTTIGRAGEIAIDDGFLGERHAALAWNRDGLRIVDLDTTNGTFVNERRITDEVLVGDVVKVGLRRLWFSHVLAAAPRGPAHVAPLVEAIHAAPDDDAPRSVLADALQQLGDPRGELIACQLAGAHERADALLLAHGLAWAGPFPVPVHHWTFARGFIDTMYVDDVDAAAVLRPLHPLAKLRRVRALVDD